MLLLLDIGNTSIKWGLWDSGVLTGTGSARHFGALPIDVLAEWDRLKGVDAVVAARVGPRSVLDAVADVAAALWHCPTRQVETRASAHGVCIAYADPKRLGVDRFLGLIGAHARYAGPKVIVDAGTAVTYDLLLGDGTHLGGLILPGIQAMRDSVLSKTQIPRVEVVESDRVWGVDTPEAVAAASIQAPSALADRLLARLEDRAGACAEIVLTGGDAERLATSVGRPPRLDPSLVLHGLSRLA